MYCQNSRTNCGGVGPIIWSCVSRMRLRRDFGPFAAALLRRSHTFRPIEICQRLVIPGLSRETLADHSLTRLAQITPYRSLAGGSGERQEE